MVKSYREPTIVIRAITRSLVGMTDISIMLISFMIVARRSLCSKRLPAMVKIEQSPRSGTILTGSNNRCLALPSEMNLARILSKSILFTGFCR